MGWGLERSLILLNLVLGEVRKGEGFLVWVWMECCVVKKWWRRGVGRSMYE